MRRYRTLLFARKRGSAGASPSRGELVARVDAAGLETALMQECEAHRRRLAELAEICRSLDLHAFARGVESLFAQSLAARGFI